MLIEDEHNRLTTVVLSDQCKNTDAISSCSLMSRTQTSGIHHSEFQWIFTNETFKFFDIARPRNLYRSINETQIIVSNGLTRTM